MSTDQLLLNVRFLTRDEYTQWDSLVATLSSASIFDEAEWLTIVAEEMRCDIRILGVFKKDRLIGGVPVTISKRFGMQIASRVPLTPTNSCITETTETLFPSRATNHRLAIKEAIGQFLQANYDYVEITNHPSIIDVRSFSWLGWRTQVLYTYRIDLPGASFTALPKKRRNLIKRAKELEIFIERDNDFSVAHDLMAKTFQHKGVKLPLTCRQLVQICTRCGEKIVQFVAKTKEGEIIASEIWLEDSQRKMVNALFAGFDFAYQETNATSLLVWQSIEYFKAKGFDTLDLVGAENKSIAHFKAEFGGNLVSYYQVSRASIKYRLLKKIMS